MHSNCLCPYSSSLQYDIDKRNEFLTYAKNNYSVRFDTAITTAEKLCTNHLDHDQAQHFVWPDLVPSCLQRLSADITAGKVFKPYQMYMYPFTYHSIIL